MDRVTADTIQLLLEGDNIITAINRVFDGPTTQGGPTISNLPVEGRLPYGQSYNEMYPPEQQMGDHSNPTNRVGNGSTGSHQSGNANNGIEEIETRGHEPQMTTPSPQMREMMEREFPSRRADETDSQYENRYLAHQRRINNTQQSWARSGYDAPPHLESASSANRGTGTGLNTGTSVPAKRQAPIPGRMHPDAPGLSQHRDAAYASLYKAPREVQFGVLPEQRQDDDEVDNPQYLDSHNGISAYRVSHGPPNNGLWNTEQYHYTVMLKRIKKLIQWKVGVSLSAPPGAKQPKMGEPAKYSGNRNHDVFLQWLNQFLNWLRSHYYCGEEADFSRLNFLGNYVEGIAADWYAADIDNPEKMTVIPMKFVDAICAMHRRFVRTATANNAVTQYDRVEYSASEGVEGFYYKLDKMASRMIERPSDYSFRLRLYEGLPAWIYDTLLERNILPEFCTLEDIRENARQIEELSLRARGTFRGSAASSLSRRIQNVVPKDSNTNSKFRGSPSGGNRSFRPNNFRTNNERQVDSKSNNVRTSTRLNNTQNRANNPAPRGQGQTGSTPSHNKPGAARGDQAHQGQRDNKQVECYRCHQIGHISTDLKCPQHPSKMGRPRFNAQRLIEDDTEGEEVIQEEHPEEHEDVQDANSWGGSQYEPEDEFEQLENDMVQEEPGENLEEEDIEYDEVRMSSMRTVQMYAMRRIREQGEIEDLPIFSRIAEPPITDIENIGQDNQGSSTNSSIEERPEGSSSTLQDTNESIHSHLFDEDVPIVDPVYIEYRDGLIFRVQPDDDWDVLHETLNENARCYICHRCRPTVRQHKFTGNHSGEEYFYLLWTCRTPVERSKAEGEIEDDEGTFDVSRFFANRITGTGSEDHSLNGVVINGIDNDRGGEESEMEEEYIPELVNLSDDEDWHPATSMEIFTPETLAYMDERAIIEQDFIRSNINCSECGECRPRIIADYRQSRNPPLTTRNLRAVCMNSGATMEIRRGFQEVIIEGTLHLRVPNTPQDTEGQNDPQESADGIPTTTGDDTESDDEEWREHRAHHHHTPPECPYCHDCRPVIEEVYYMASDGEVFYRDRLVCQNTTATEASNNTRLQAMRTVYSSNVRRNTPYRGEQPIRTPQLQATLSAEVEINGVKALTLFDTGSTTDSITPEFAFATKAKTFKLDEQVILQLGCVGSRSKISYGARVPIGFGDINDEVYYDLVNIDRYDCIIGTPFMNTHKVCLDFGTRSIRINGQEIPALSFEEEQRRVDKHKQLRSQKHARPPPRETAPLKRRVVSGPLPSTSI